jgi:hypothetical protein
MPRRTMIAPARNAHPLIQNHAALVSDASESASESGSDIPYKSAKAEASDEDEDESEAEGDEYATVPLQGLVPN